MLCKAALILSISVLASSTLLADFSYDQTSTITGGAIARMMKMVGVFSKKAREPITGTTKIKGNKLLHRDADTASIIDLDAQTITHINFQKKTYSVMTFEQMKQMLDDMSKRMKQNNAQMQFKVSVKPTGATRQISGLQAREMLVTMEMEGTDQQSGQTGGMVITDDMWIAPAISGYDEARNFYKRMAQKINWTPGNVFMMNPQVSQGMAEVYKQAAELDGMPVLQIITMTPQGQPVASASQQPAPPPQQDQQQDKPSMTDAVGGALAGHFGFGHRKKQKQQDEDQQPQSSSADSSTPGSLLEMNTASTNFSSRSVDSSEFAIPAGFRQVEPDTRRMAQ